MGFGVGEVGERLGNTVDRDRAGDQRPEVDLTLGDRAQRLGELVGLVPEGELDVELPADADHRVEPILLHADADDEDARALRRHPHRRVDHPRHADGLEDDERAHAVDIAPRVDGGALGGVDDDVTTKVLGQSTTPRREVGADDRTDADALELGDARQPDRTEPEHDRGIAGRDAALHHGVDADGERFGQRGEVGRQPGRHVDGEQLVEHHQLGVAAGVAVGEPDRVDPVGVERHRHADDHVPRLQPLDSGPVSRTSQQNSWPITVGASGSNMTGRIGSGGASASSSSLSRRASWPWSRRWRSLPQIPQARTFVSTCPAAGSGSATSSTRKLPVLHHHGAHRPSVRPGRRSATERGDGVDDDGERGVARRSR